MPGRRRILAFAVPVSLATAALCLVRGISVETSIYAMLGDNAAAIPEDVRDESSRMALAVISSGSSTASRDAERKFRANIQDGSMSEHVEPCAERSLGAILRRADCLVAEQDRKTISTPEGRAKIARAAIHRYAASPLPPVFSPDEDPFCLKERFVAALGESPDRVVALPLRAETAGSTARLEKFRHLVLAAADAARRESDPSVKIMLCGVPLHALHATLKCRREIGWLSAFSLLFVAGVALVALRPASRAAYVAANLAASASAGAAALFLCFPSFHVMTAVFGTSVLGIAADYSFHWLLGSPGETRSTVKNLAMSFTTTALALAPLAMSSLPVLRESAVFLAAALAVAFAFAVLALPVPRSTPDAGAAKCRTRTAFAVKAAAAAAVAAICAVAAFAAPRFRVKTDPASLYAPPEELAEPERILADKWAAPSGETVENVRRLYEEQGAKIKDALGLAREPAMPSPPQSGAAALASALDSLTSETKTRLSYALLAMLAVLAAVYRLGAPAVAAPPALAFLAAAAAVAFSGQSINLFHLLAGFLLAGMCVDYAVFMRSGECGALKSVTCSLLTSMAGFGALAFVSFRPVAAFGTVLGAGLPAGYLAAVALGRRPWSAGHSTEKAASPLGMEIIWLCYRVFGLAAMRFLARSVANIAWFSSAGVRAACPSRRKISMFARSLADKIAVASGRGRMPPVRDDGSEDAAAFADDVKSGRGVFVLSSHCGTVEALLALAKDPPVFHAWTDMDKTESFNEFYARHARARRISLHPVSGVGMGTAFEAAGWLENGECLVMAGDRGAGAFRFAAALGHPAYFATCLADGPGYTAIIRRLPGSAGEMENRYRAILEELEKLHPEQTYEWN